MYACFLLMHPLSVTTYPLQSWRGAGADPSWLWVSVGTHPEQALFFHTFSLTAVSHVVCVYLSSIKWVIFNTCNWAAPVIQARKAVPVKTNFLSNWIVLSNWSVIGPGLDRMAVFPLHLPACLYMVWISAARVLHFCHNWVTCLKVCPITRLTQYYWGITANKVTLLIQLQTHYNFFTIKAPRYLAIQMLL